MKYCGCGYGCGCQNSCGYPRMRIRMRSSDTPLVVCHRRQLKLYAVCRNSKLDQIFQNTAVRKVFPLLLSNSDLKLLVMILLLHYNKWVPIHSSDGCWWPNRFLSHCSQNLRLDVLDGSGQPAHPVKGKHSVLILCLITSWWDNRIKHANQKCAGMFGGTFPTTPIGCWLGISLVFGKYNNLK